MEQEKPSEEIKKERDEYLAGWQRARADFINYKKEEAGRLKGFMEYAEQGFLYSLLPVVDNLERAEKELQGDKDSKLAEGFFAIGKQLRDILKSHGVVEVEAEGKAFDPSLHEAIEEVEGEKSGFVAEVLEKGYLLKNQLLRPAKVKVTK
jgi:molecular chaperone GrpE